MPVCSKYILTHVDMESFCKSLWQYEPLTQEYVTHEKPTVQEILTVY
jgi:hypothetical protein